MIVDIAYVDIRSLVRFMAGVVIEKAIFVLPC